eukprot:TRINITY_DN14645_c0_g1_i1.p1 TRINITY_DN14645_c0_g1~~TRINITY_DN14645_c0_g1_i1.p1  ORF type:complete len:120 (+),score=12.03 TRINITY_DN14645_c0_g1_i1:171-530(+)
MDIEFEKTVAEVSGQPGVTGVLAADRNGLCVLARGAATPESAGWLVATARERLLQQRQTMPDTIDAADASADVDRAPMSESVTFEMLEPPGTTVVVRCPAGAGAGAGELFVALLFAAGR